MYNPAIPIVKTNVYMFRNVRGLTQQQLADQAGISRQSLHRIEAEKSLPGISVALLLAQALKEPVEALFEIRYVLPKDKQFIAMYPFRLGMRKMPKLYSKHKRTQSDGWL